MFADHRITEKTLSNRETDVLAFTAQGINPVGVADLLGISAHTVCKHLSNVRQKLNARNTTHAVAMAMGERLISLNVTAQTNGRTIAQYQAKKHSECSR